MKSRDVLNRLGFHQDRMLATIDRAYSVVREGPATALAALARERWTMARYIREYQVFKHTEIFDPVIRCGGPTAAGKAQRLAAQCIALSKEFEAHLRYWSGRDIAAEWELYRPAMLAMMGKLRCAFSRERASVVDLLAGVEHTRRLLG